MLSPSELPVYLEFLEEDRRLIAEKDNRVLRVALLCDFTSHQLLPPLRVLLNQARLSAEIWEAPFGTVNTEVLNPNSALYRFQADVIVIIGATQALRTEYYGVGAHKSNFASTSVARFQSLWKAIRANSNAWIVQANFVEPYESFFGQFDGRIDSTFTSAVQNINRGLTDGAKEDTAVLLCDLAGIASYLGRRSWFTETLWVHSKTLCSLNCLPYVAKRLADLLEALYVRTIKCVVVDLDNTLWGGVIGDDGIDGIVLSPEGEGEAFRNLQCFLLELKRRGVILAVSSKNDPEKALAVFREHPYMVLREADIAVFAVNWQNKADNIRTIRETLNIGYDSMVFLDDNPFERNLVRKYLPEVTVVELPEDPAEYVRAIAEQNLFEVTSFTREDRERTEMYRLEAQRSQVAQSFANVDDYLRALDMEAEIARFDEAHLERIHQLIQRSNQFNLTTRRYSKAELEAFMRSDSVLPLYVGLRDRLASYGLISVIILTLTGGEAQIASWLMSCRVLSRGLEQWAMNQAVEAVRRRGGSTIIGEYIATPKNGMVRDFYAQFGFDLLPESTDERRTWRLDVRDYSPTQVHIRGSLSEQGLVRLEGDTNGAFGNQCRSHGSLSARI
jgi:FkbH-like protein